MRQTWVHSHSKAAFSVILCASTSLSGFSVFWIKFARRKVCSLIMRVPLCSETSSPPLGVMYSFQSLLDLSDQNFQFRQGIINTRTNRWPSKPVYASPNFWFLCNLCETRQLEGETKRIPAKIVLSSQLKNKNRPVKYERSPAMRVAGFGVAWLRGTNKLFWKLIRKNNPSEKLRTRILGNTSRKMGSQPPTVPSVLVDEMRVHVKTEVQAEGEVTIQSVLVDDMPVQVNDEVQAQGECIVVMSLVVRVHADLLQHRKSVARVALANALEPSLLRMSRTTNCTVRGAYIPARLAALRSASAFVSFSARFWHLTAGETPPFLQGSHTATRRGLLLLQVQVKSPCRLCSLAH